MTELKLPGRIETERLVLRRPTTRDARAIFESYASDPEATRYLMWRPHTSIEETHEFLRRQEQTSAEGAGDSFLIERKEDGALIGMIGIHPADFRALIGYVLARAHWGRGYATEAARAIVDWALAQPGIYRVWAVCDVDNLASARVLEKAGMTREGRLGRWSLHPNVSGEPRDCWCYAKVK